MLTEEQKKKMEFEIEKITKMLRYLNKRCINLTNLSSNIIKPRKNRIII